MKKAARKGSYHHGDLRRALLTAATKLLAEEGAEALTLREVAKRAGVSHAAPYHHFPDRASLLAAVAAAGFESLAAQLRSHASVPGADPVEQLRGSGEGYVRFALANPAQYRVMFSAEVADKAAHPELKEAADGAFAYLTELSRVALTSLGADPEEAPGYALAGWSMMHGLATLWMDGLIQEKVGLDLEFLTRRFGALLVSGLRAEVAKPRSSEPAKRTKKRNAP